MPVRSEQIHDYRRAIGRFATGVAIVSAAHDGRRFAMTTNSLTSVSLDPIQLLVCFKQDSDTLRAVLDSGRFGVSILNAKSGIELSKRFARKLAVDENDQLEGVKLHPGYDDLPLFADSIALMRCEVERNFTSGDHEIVVGNVVEFKSGPDEGGSHCDPIIFYQGGYYRLERCE